jgi:LacI family transcriptional regulator
MAITMREVARHAGVSVATVSRVFNGSGPVGPTTRLRIERVARQLRYVPNRAAQSLNTTRTYTLGVVLPDLYGAFFSELLRGLDAAARRYGYHLLVAGAEGGGEGLAVALRSMSGRTDGLVVMSTGDDDDVLEANLSPTLPVVRLGGTRPALLGTLALCVDNEGGAAEATRHLVSLGHRRVVHLSGPPGNADAYARERGYRAALADAGLEAEVIPGDFTEAAGVRVARDLLASPNRPSALFAANDAMAVGALAAQREAGYPGAIAVVGFDDIPLAQHMHPPLTTVHVPIQDLGCRAVERLRVAVEDGVELLGGPPDILPAALIVRASCGTYALPPTSS